MQETNQLSKIDGRLLMFLPFFMAGVIYIDNDCHKKGQIVKMLPRDESLYKRIKMQQVAERLITGTAQTTEHIITNNTGRSFLLLAQMQGGSGDINQNLRHTFTEGHYVWNSHGSGNAYDILLTKWQ